MPIKNFYELTPSLSRCHDGEGLVKIVSVFDKTLASHLRFIHYTCLPPGTTIGLHKHGNDEEVYVILEGMGEMDVDGVRSPVKPGDVILNVPFGTHALYNTSPDVELRILVFAASGK